MRDLDELTVTFIVVSGVWSTVGVWGIFLRLIEIRYILAKILKANDKAE